MKQKATDVPISVHAVDREKHTISLTVDGCPVTAVCAPNDNTEVFQDIKEMLIDSLVRAVKNTPRKLDKT